MKPVTGGSGTSSRPDRAVWTRVAPLGAAGAPLDLLTARIGRRHYAPHAHDEYAIGVCVEGREVLRYRGERIFSGVGSVIVIEPGEAHTGGPADVDGFSYVALYPDAALLHAALPRRHAPHFRAGVFDDHGLDAALRRAHRALSRGDDPLEAEYHLLSMLNALIGRHADPAARTADDAGPTRAAEIARAVADRLAAESVSPPSLATLAAELDLSRYQVLRAFREAKGMPPYAWLAQHRVARARTLLDAGRRPADAAAEAGFADQAHLTRWFRKVLGVTPGAYRAGITRAHQPSRKAKA
ncbi:AraC family transcriptional regulator [Actinomadura rayongensis]|uniref:Helix-turn-helix domain-containing protein n=1 Tax=Actinomadura rayongensis TaxID=1429076 RepID=A0A6I4WEU5_9ACTN|nr:AraC family transcriptional regulator [Actinomadura rayongensis]MXQ65444.1 helix-turn-helix domain-containing protein [Actinomadura rayongensis]